MVVQYDIDTIDEDISDEQIEQLLQNAEKRLKGQLLALPGNPKTQLSHRDHQLHNTKLAKPYVSTSRGVARADTSRMLSDKDRHLATEVRQVEDPILVRGNIAKLVYGAGIIAKISQIQEKQATAGSNWFNLPRTDLTPELKRDLQLLKMRNVLDPKRHYKKESGNKPPEFSQVGTIIEAPTEFYSARIPNKERKKTFVDEVLAAEESTRRFKSKYNAIQSSKMSGKKAYYKELKDKRSGGIRRR